ncbi:MAG TPA: glycosyltransferase [Phycisphaerae bacterium]|nr:glycosyltransferase [Phycisphaerae bacterium]
MKAFLTFPACHRRGGVERIMAECANYLARRGHEVSVLSGEFDQGVLDERVAPVRIACESRSRILKIAAYRKRAEARLRELRTGGKSVHASFGVACPPGGVLWVQSVHAEWIKLSAQHRGFKGRLKQRLNPFHPYILRRERDYFAGRKYRRLIALTPRIREELAEHYGVPDRDVDLLPNGFNPEEFHVGRRSAEREAVRAELGIGRDERVVVFVANELERKGFFPLARALGRMKREDVRLVVAGRVDLAGHAEFLRELGIAGRVRCVGPSADVGRYYAVADVFALPTYYEAWGLVIVEALASGLPVLTSRLAGAAAAVEEGRTGLLVEDPHDEAEIAGKLEKLLAGGWASPAEISASVERYRWQEVLAEYERILAENCG